MRRKNDILKWGCGCLSLLMMSGALRAQEPAPVSKATDSSTANTMELSEIVVTGSRTSRDSYTAPTPVTAINSEQMLKATPTNLPDALNQLPQFANSLSQRNGNAVDPAQQSGGNNLDLRGLGPNRVLILLDGQRVAPNNSFGTVDVNTFPQLLVSRVDVVTAGVSAVYGANAMSGVVNFVLDKEFQGIKGYMQGGISGHGDDGSYAGGIALGKSLADDRLHLLFSAEGNHSNGIPSMKDRPLGGKGYMRAGSGTATDPYVTIPNVRQSPISYGGYVLNGPLAGMTFLADGTLAPYDFGRPLSRGYQVGGDGATWGDATLMPSLTTTSLFGRADYRIGDNVKAYVQASYSTSEAITPKDYWNYDFFDITVFQNNAFLTQAQRDALQAANTPSFAFGRINRDLGYISNDLDNKVYRLAAGLEGQFADHWSWKTHVTYGNSKLDGRIEGQTKPVQLAAALDAVRAPNGQIACNITLTNPGLRDDCVPLNLLGEGRASQAAIDYVTGTSLYTVINDALELGAEVSGNLFTLPGGPLAAALGASYRRESIDQTTNSDPAVPIDATGIRGVFGTTAFTQTNFGPAKGSNNAKELFFETTAPVLADLPLIHNFTLNGAARYVDYSSFGGKSVWKAGFVYEPTAELRFRLTKSRDIRAPTLNDQFAGQQTSATAIFDPLTKITANTLAIGGGNPRLEPEKGDTLTYGLGYRPEWLPGLSLAADYYDVKVTDAISNIFAGTILSLCDQSGYTDPLCKLVTRPFPITNTSAANFPTTVNSLSALNIGFLQTKGIDFDAGYAFNPGFVPGRVGIHLLANYVDSYKLKGSPGVPTYEFAGSIGRGLLKNGYGAIPNWRGTLSVNYDNGPLSLFVQERFIESLSQVGGNTPNDVYGDGSGKLPAVFYTDLTLEYEFKRSGLKAFFSVNNLFDRNPPILAYQILPDIIYPAAGTVYDLVGRYMTVGIRAKF